MSDYNTQLLQKIENRSLVIGVIGLGYVGLPLAVEFGKKYKVIGFDINTKRVEELKKGEDKTLEVEAEELSEAIHLIYSYDKEELREVDLL
jgi:UDP-N-acetyl-D-galactosamine dehydrogenase